MNFPMILSNLGIVLCIEAACMLPSLFIAMYSRQGDTAAFLISIFILVFIGFSMSRIKTARTKIYARDGIAIVALGWFLVSVFGALPFMISGAIPSFTDAVFETVSGFTTTGSSILKAIEGLPQGILFWRSFTHWLGGMGVLVLALALLPSVGASTFHIMKAESPGPTLGKLVPKIGQTAKILYVIYIVLTLVQVIFLLTAKMSLFDAFIHAFGTAGTGGFSNKNLSVGAYGSAYVDWIITIFMLMFGANFALYFQIIKGNVKHALRDEEFRFYIGTVLLSIALITININGKFFFSIWEEIRYSAFQVSSIITTTGFATTDFNLWPAVSKFILVLLMFIGASASSTGGGIKCIRILVLFKIVRREISKIIRPRSVQSITINGIAVDEETLSGIMTFFFLYIAIFVVSVLIVSFDCENMITSITAVAATIGNIGPGLEAVGPMGNFSDFSPLSKWVFSICMLFGRLEIYPVLLMLAPSFWKRVSI